MPSTPLFHRGSPDDQQSSPFLPLSTARQLSDRTPAKDPLLHRILDKNWRLQATPHSQARGVGAFPYRVKATETPRPSPRKRDQTLTRTRDLDDLDSSPPAPAPTLHAEIFDSPLRRPRVPGVSVFTPARKQRETGPEGGKARDDVFTSKGKWKEEDRQSGRGGAVRDIANIWDSDSDDEGGLEGMSPPKTMQFHVPQTRLLRTPGKSFLSIFLHLFPTYHTSPVSDSSSSSSSSDKFYPLLFYSSPRSQQTNSRRPPPHSWGQHHGRLGRGESKRGEAGGIIGGRHFLKRLFFLLFSPL